MQNQRQRKAIPFIVKNQSTNLYQLTKQAEELLKKIDKNVSVVSVAGLYRTGKSYLLNRVILDKKNIFGVGPTVNPCTKGLWLWVQPDPTSEKRSMLIIDTQGLGALDEQVNHDMKIFCLAVLLSTTFIYNSVGSIDENALQTLSLVLNLVNTIDQQNTSNKPHFIWVVRDFTLQLIDDKGKSLTPQQYLQLALNINTKQAQKTSIRKTITNAFTQRDCYTLVKPLIDETKLQNLDNIPMDQLRPEFVSQSIELRNKIKSTLKQFKLTSNINNITGREYVMVVQKYISAINSGAVPNMIDTWTFIKEQKCREAVEEIKKIFTERFKTKLIPKIPLRRVILQQQLKSMKAEMKAMYIKMTYEESSTEIIEQFYSNAQAQIFKLNSQQSRVTLKNILSKQFEPFMKKLYSHYYNNFEELEQELNRNYKQLILEKYADKLDDVKETVQKFVDQKLLENYKFFQKKLRDQIKSLKIVKQQLQQSLGNQISQISSIKQKERRAHQQKIFDLQKRLRLLENEKQHLLENGRTEKELLQSNLVIVKRKNEEQSQLIDELNKQISLLHSAQNQVKQKNFLEHKEHQKQKALFVQKQEHLNNKIRDIQQKCLYFENKLNQTGGKLQLQKKGIMRQYQQKIESLEQENKRLSEKVMQTEQKLGKILDEAKDLTDQIQSIKNSNMSEKKKLQLKIVQAQSNKKASRIEQELKQQNQELTIQIQKGNQKIQEFTKKVKICQEQMKSMQTNYQKEIAIHTQQIQFQQLQINQYKTRYQQLKKSYQNAIQNLHDNSKNKENSNQLKLYELTIQHQKQLKNMEIENEEKVKSLKKQIQMLQKHKESLILQHSLDKQNLQIKEKQWKESTSILQNMVKKLEQKIESSEKDHEDISKQKQSFYAVRIKQLQQQLEEVKEKASQENSQNSKKSQQAFAVLKHYSDMEKQQWEKRLHDQKDKGQKRLKNLRDELQKKFNQEKMTLEEEVSDLQSRLAHMDRVFNERLQNMQYDHDIAIQKITNQLMQEKVQLNKELALTQQKFEMMKNSFQKELGGKIKYYENLLQSTKTQMKQQYEESIIRLTGEKENLQQKCDSLKKSNRQLEQSNLILKSQSDKQRAVYKQKERSFEKKVIELQNRLQSQLENYNRNIENIHHRHSVQINKLNQQIDKLNINVTNLQEEKDRMETEHENSMNRLQLKLKVFEDTKNKSKQDYEDMVNKFQTAVTHFGNHKKKLEQEKVKTLAEASQKTNQNMRIIQQAHKKMMKESEDRIARLVTENKSLKQRLVVMQLQKSTSSKKPYIDEIEKQKIDRKYQKRIEEYKELYQKQKQKFRKLKDQYNRLKMQMDTSSYHPGNSNITYYERPSFSEISNSRLYNDGIGPNTTQIKRKYTNTPGMTSQKGIQQFTGPFRFNPGTGYKNRD